MPGAAALGGRGRRAGLQLGSWAVLYRGLTAPSPHCPKQEALLPAVVALRGLFPLGRLEVDPALLPCFPPYVKSPLCLLGLG